jgi:hypothetical protein
MGGVTPGVVMGDGALYYIGVVYFNHHRGFIRALVSLHQVFIVV